MPRAFWKGTISFGMVAIPVRMSTATRDTTPSFHLLHKKDLVRPKQVLHCPQDGETFSVKDTVRGYEFAKGHYVVFSESDFQNVPVKTTHTIDISAFVDEKEIDPIYYYDTHYLEPEELGVKPYALLREALVRTGRVGIARVSFQRREHLCSLRPMDGIIVLHTMHYHDEILPREDIAPPKHEVNDKELQMATALIDAMTRKFNPGEYKDEYTIALKKMIQAKMQGEEIKAPAPAPEIEVEDLMAALRASIEQAKAGSAR